VRAQTLGDLRRGLRRQAGPRDPACDESAPLWDAVGLPDDTPVSVLRDRWDPLAACLLAVADGRGPRVSAVAWVERALGTAVLRGVDLQRAVLWGADLTGADLRGADLRDAVLTGAVLTGAILTSAVLEGADLRGAYLRGAVLWGAVLTGAVLEGAWADVAPDGWVLRDGRLRRAARKRARE
jgi:hypothetical protein